MQSKTKQEQSDNKQNVYEGLYANSREWGLTGKSSKLSTTLIQTYPLLNYIDQFQNEMKIFYYIYLLILVSFLYDLLILDLLLSYLLIFYLINNIKIDPSMIPEDQFIGKFENQNYIIFKEYIDTEITQIKLYHTRYTPPNPKYTIVIIHGFGEHSHRFRLIADFFAKNQFQVLTVDLRGFGYSGGPRGCSQIRQLQNDVILLLKRARPDLPLFMYAHSLGGLVTIKLLLQRNQINVSGCIITSPLLGLGKNIKFNWIKEKVINHIGEDLSDFIVGSQVNPTALTKNKQYMHTIFMDRLMLPFMSVKMAKHIIQSLKYVQRFADDFRYPVIVFHGKLDTVTEFQNSRKFVYNKIKPFKQFVQFPNGYHELQHDEQKQQLLRKSLQFIKKIPNPKNFGPMTVPVIPKPLIKKRPILPFILFIIAVIFIIKRLRNK